MQSPECSTHHTTHNMLQVYPLDTRDHIYRPLYNPERYHIYQPLYNPERYHIYQPLYNPERYHIYQPLYNPERYHIYQPLYNPERYHIYQPLYNPERYNIYQPLYNQTLSQPTPHHWIFHNMASNRTHIAPLPLPTKKPSVSRRQKCSFVYSTDLIR
ncbi:uncharacterized protein LOC144861111 [Branchiostoma floridae x Branchiostoma japonicum]